ncbi:BQ5605_C006g04183 [Microbotryum silenes-dioicae]|uniref:beta-glucosidase n=1 Tax=Microbotryum silenes-dioicae TaxID=796604 RepID=A0A2X0MAC8_9BASI|nr:BQ5605_C006g04183 [Microbotryum silenes-dioicae]
MKNVTRSRSQCEDFGGDPSQGPDPLRCRDDDQRHPEHRCDRVRQGSKHHVANEQEHYQRESGAIISFTNTDDRVMCEVYNHPFSESIRAGVGSIMCSYNLINQTHACKNSYLMNKLAKQDLAFHCFVVSDWAAQTSGVSSALAGLDMSMPGFRSYTEGLDNQQNPTKSNTSYWGAELFKAVNNGSVPLAQVKLEVCS